MHPPSTTPNVVSPHRASNHPRKTTSAASEETTKPSETATTAYDAAVRITWWHTG